MSANQDQLFLWQWGRRRRLGRLRMALLGFAIGALGGLTFTILMFGFGGNMSINHEEVPPALQWAAKLGPVAFMLVMAVPAFGALGAILIDRVFQSQEAQYQNLLARGVMPPTTKPALAASERGPMIAVILAVVVIIAFILFVAIAL